MQNLWKFSVELYERPDISALCLSLQDRYHVNVCILLWLVWLGKSGRIYNAADVQKIINEADTLGKNTAEKIRNFRRAMMTDNAIVEEMKQKIKHALLPIELEMEKRLINMLQEQTVNIKTFKKAPEKYSFPLVVSYLNSKNVPDSQDVVSRFSSSIF